MGDTTASGMISSVALLLMPPANLIRRNAAAFCASNPRRAAVYVKASKGSIVHSPMTQRTPRQTNPWGSKPFQSWPLRGGRAGPTAALRKARAQRASKPRGAGARMGGRATNGEVNDAKGKAAALAWIRVLPEIEPFFRRPGFVIIRAQCLVAHWPGNCGLVVAGSATAGAGHGLRRLGVGCEDADCSASSTGGAYGRHGGLLRCVNADGPHVVVFGALSTSAMHYLASPDRLPREKGPRRNVAKFRSS
jgi:hypothetical protein